MKSIGTKSISALIGELITAHQRIWEMHNQIAKGDNSKAQDLLIQNERRVSLMRELEIRLGAGDILGSKKGYG